MAAYDVVDVADLEGEGPGGMVRKVRRSLGAKAFGFNYFVFPPDQEGREHDRPRSGPSAKRTGGRGLGKPGGFPSLGRLIRIDPAASRVPISGSDGLELVTFGAPLDRQYEPPSWG